MSAPSTEPDHEDATYFAGSLSLAIAHVSRRLRLSRVVDELTFPQRVALYQLDRGGPMTAAALARREQVSPQTMSVTVARLNELGLLERRRDPNDGRQTLITLSAAGRRKVQKRHTARVHQVSKALAAEFTPAELRTLAEAAPLLFRLAERLQEGQPVAG